MKDISRILEFLKQQEIQVKKEMIKQSVIERLKPRKVQMN